MIRAGVTFAILLGAALGVVALAAYEPEVVSLELAPVSLAVAPGVTEALSATVRTRFPDPLQRAAVRWSVVPDSLGSVDAAGRFHAGDRSGTGVVLATGGGASASIPLVIGCPASTTSGGITFSASCAGPADVYLESGLAPAVAQRILDAAVADVAQVEATYARTFTRRPLVYVFGTKQSFARGLTTTLANGSAVPTAAVEADGVYVSGSDLIGIDWEEASRFQPFTTLRHELSHQMVAELTARAPAALPAWFDEGSARLAEETIDGTAWLAARERFFALSMAATATLLPLDELADVRAWGARSGALADGQYHEAAMAVSFLRDDLGMPGLLRVLAAIDGGADFAAAYESVSDRPFASFATAFPARLKALAGAPGVVAAADTPSGPGLTLILYGFTPGTPVTVTLSGSRREGRSLDTVSAFGSAILVVGGDLPPGTYTVRAAGANGIVTITARKP